MYKHPRLGLAAIVGIGVLAIAVTWMLPEWQAGDAPPPAAPPPAAAVQTVTMTGYDPATGETIDPINIFDRLPWGKRVGTVPSGAQVVLLDRSGDIAHIRTADGVEGYVAAAFIKEFR